MRRVYGTGAIVAGAVVVVLAGASAQASGSIERACLKADRPNATPGLCRCIQGVANAMLSSTERSKVAKFFKDPHASQETRQSDSRRDENFWERYKAFGDVVERQCRG